MSVNYTVIVDGKEREYIGETCFSRLARAGRGWSRAAKESLKFRMSVNPKCSDPYLARITTLAILKFFEAERTEGIEYHYGGDNFAGITIDVSKVSKVYFYTLMEVMRLSYEHRYMIETLNQLIKTFKCDVPLALTLAHNLMYHSDLGIWTKRSIAHHSILRSYLEAKSNIQSLRSCVPRIKKLKETYLDEPSYYMNIEEIARTYVQSPTSHILHKLKTISIKRGIYQQALQVIDINSLTPIIKENM